MLEYSKRKFKIETKNSKRQVFWAQIRWHLIQRNRRAKTANTNSICECVVRNQTIGRIALFDLKTKEFEVF